ncbi:DAK2 domain-containing protein [Ruminococcus albus]|uniref:DAK2 domain fusion protein YloV n=1 Tax=Ruminococcus albus (strain ATCC 27210 / DSM 20455 / JCM 14654 / NCDO 2250 / 7) TaxID=697329 RepID=E6UE38_RUMA7|nr:DAK2 domain-containing protein [Ruminococcus albus]ADU22903.1 DAK2 domain fusion protein YloV [Ruminococcus albus 7 = DSM 20455]
MINGNMLRRAFISGAHSITNKKKSVDELNVFPVPDGDTGSNMSMTINNSVAELENLGDNVPVSTVASTAASCLLRGARGNSGVILSLIFRGFSKGLAGKSEMGAEDLVNSLELGVQGAYKSVMKPTEGTILTVAREAAEKARETLKSTNDPRAVMADVCAQAKITLDKTPKLLPALAKAGVVDAGGMGLLIIFEAMRDVFEGGEIVEQKAQPVEKKTVEAEGAVTVDTFSSVVGQYDAEINFTYCTEMLITKKPDCDDPIKLRAYLETIGDCVVVVDDDEIIKVHVHTNNPGKAIEKGLEFGYINFPKVENMKLQHEKEQKKAKSAFTPAEQTNEFGFVAVAAGNGIETMFKDLGVDCVVKGGQTMNPSTQDILEAIMSCPAKTVFVLPNNKNIIMAAEQAVKLADRKVCVLQTRTIPQGMSAMLAYDPDADFNTNRIEMTAAIERVSTGQITFAARDSDYEGHSIKQGEILAMDNGRLSFVDKDLAKAAFKLTKKLVKGDSSYITVIYGSDVTDDSAQALYKQISNKYSNLDVNLINGGQPVYYYIISVE